MTSQLTSLLHNAPGLALVVIAVAFTLTVVVARLLLGWVLR